MSNDIPNFNLLAVFTAVIEQGSLSKAADHLNTNQSTISTALGRLKNEIGQELFVRKGRGVVPTSYSQSLYEQIKAPVHQLNSVFQSMAEFDEKTSDRTFVISAPEHLQWALLDSFSSLPNSKLSLEIHDQPDSDDGMYDDLLTQKYDAMIDIVVPNHPNTASQKLFEGEFVIVCREGHPRIKGKITESMYMSERHAVLERTRNKMLSLGHYTTLDISKRKVAFYGRSLFSNLLLCSQSDCVTVVPHSLAMQFKEKLSLQLFNPPFDYVPMSNHLIWLNKQAKDPAHIWLRSKLIETTTKMSSELKASRIR